MKFNKCFIYLAKKSKQEKTEDVIKRIKSIKYCNYEYVAGH